MNFRVLKLRFLFFSRGPGGFRELREAGRNHFHLSWYLSVPVVTSYGQKPSWGDFFKPSTVGPFQRLYKALQNRNFINRDLSLTTGRVYIINDKGVAVVPDTPQIFAEYV